MLDSMAAAEKVTNTWALFAETQLSISVEQPHVEEVVRPCPYCLTFVFDATPINKIQGIYRYGFGQRPTLQCGFDIQLVIVHSSARPIYKAP
jgi:hypothetical protein